MATLLSCVSSSPSGGQGTGQDPGLLGDGAVAAGAADVNPYGVPYPSDNIGTGQRSGTRPGNRIANFKFLGYRDGDRSKGLTPISLADFFDPESRTTKLIHIQAVATWCDYCKAESELVLSLTSKLAERKVLWLVSVAEGPTRGMGATTRDLDQWMVQFKLPLTHVLDSGNRNLGVFYDAAAFPWNAVINAKTMEILHGAVGGLTTEKQLLDSVDGWLGKFDRGEL